MRERAQPDSSFLPDAAVVNRIREGDREAAARFITENEGIIRRRFRHRLGRAARRLVDSQDLVSTIARRLDQMVRAGAARVETQGHLWSLIFRIGERAAADKGRIMARLERVEGPDSELAYEWRCRFARAERRERGGMEIELDAMLRTLADPMDREILTMWLMGQSFVAIAQEMGLAPEMVRKRWERIRSTLRTGFILEEMA